MTEPTDRPRPTARASVTMPAREVRDVKAWFRWSSLGMVRIPPWMDDGDPDDEPPPGAEAPRRAA